MVSKRVLSKLGIAGLGAIRGVSAYELLSNQMKIILVPNPTTRMAAFVQHIHAGSRHEGAGTSGYMHIKEHSQFFESARYNASNGNSFDQFMKLMGGHVNATTSADWTRYYGVVPAAYLAHLMAYEAYRLSNPSISEIDLRYERQVILDELEISQNQPDSLLYKAMMATMFTEHPYRLPVIGSRGDIANVQPQALLQLSEIFYHPNNTTLIVVGGFNPEQALHDIANQYGQIPPSSEPIPTPHIVEAPQWGERRFKIGRAGDLTRVMIGFHIPEALHTDTYALQALSIVLGGGSSGRLHRELVETGLVTSAYCYSAINHDPTSFIFAANVAHGVKPEVVEAALIAAIDRIRNNAVTKRELEQARALNRNGTAIANASNLRRALQISSNIGAATWVWGECFDDNFDSVTVDNISMVAQRYFTSENRTVGYFIPTLGTAPQPNAGQVVRRLEKKPLAESLASHSPLLHLTPLTTPTNYAERVRRVVLSNGLTVLLLSTPSSASAVSLTLNAGSNCRTGNVAVAPVVAAMLTEGSTRLPKEQIAHLCALCGADLDFTTDATRVSVTTLVPAKLTKFFDLLAEVLQRPNFDEVDLNRMKERILASLESARVNPDARASLALRRLVFKEQSPFYPPTISQQKSLVRAIDVQDLNDFHGAFYGPKGAVLTIIGDFDTSKMLARVKSKFGAWTGGADRHPETQPTAQRTTQNRKLEIIPEKHTLTLLIGLPVDLKPGDDDYLAAIIANKALGGDTITSRLGREVRGRAGLTYGITSHLVDTTNGGGLFTIRMTTQLQNVAHAEELIRTVVDEYVTGGIGETELRVEKIELSASHDEQLDSVDSIAATLTSFEHSGRGLAFLDKFQERLAAITKTDIDAAIRKHFRMEGAVTIIAGTVRPE